MEGTGDRGRQQRDLAPVWTARYILAAMMDGLNVLVVRFGALGNVVLTTPLVRAIHRTHPHAAITFVTKEAYAPLLTGNPHLYAVEPHEPGASLGSLAARLRRTRWDHRIDLHGSVRSFMLRRLVGGPWSVDRPPRTQRTLHIWFGIEPPGGGEPVARRHFRAARGLDLTPDSDPPEVYPSPNDEQVADGVVHRAFVAIAPGAAHATKRWPARHWRELADRLDAAGRSVVVLGTAAERGAFGGTRAIDACGIGLGPTAALLRRAQVAITNDSGLMHVAAAVGTPLIALFGPTVASFGFAPGGDTVTRLERALPCRPCSPFGSAHCPVRHHRCMIDITPADVVARLPAA